MATISSIEMQEVAALPTASNDIQSASAARIVLGLLAAGPSKAKQTTADNGDFNIFFLIAEMINKQRSTIGIEKQSSIIELNRQERDNQNAVQAAQDDQDTLSNKTNSKTNRDDFKTQHNWSPTAGFWAAGVTTGLGIIGAAVGATLSILGLAAAAAAAITATAAIVGIFLVALAVVLVVVYAIASGIKAGVDHTSWGDAWGAKGLDGFANFWCGGKTSFGKDDKKQVLNDPTAFSGEVQGMQNQVATDQTMITSIQNMIQQVMSGQLASEQGADDSLSKTLMQMYSAFAQMTQW